MNKIMKKLFIFTTSVFVLLLAACDTGFSINKRKSNNEEKLVQIHPVIQQQDNRTALPETDYENFNKETLSDVVFSYSNASTSKKEFKYSTADDLETAEIHIPEGEYDFALSAKCGGLVFSGTVTQTISLEDNNTISFVLYPSASTTSTKGNYGTLKITLELPVVSALTYSGKVTLNGVEALVSDSDFIFDDTEDTLVFQKKLAPAVNPYEIELKLCNQDNNVFIFTTTALIEKDKISKETYEVGQFFKGYKITWHISSTEKVETYYATTYGFELYQPNNYTWYTDAACTEGNEAVAGVAGVVEGNKEFWAEANEDYGYITIYDYTDTTTPIKKLSVPVTGSFKINYNYVVTTYDSDNSECESFDLLSKDGYWVYSLYKTSSGNSFSTNSIYTYASYQEIYVSYKPYKTITLISENLNPGAVIGTYLCKDNIYLYDSYISIDGTSYYINGKANGYYNKTESKKYSKNMYIYPSNDLTIYVDDYVDTVYTVNIINKKTEEVTNSFTTKTSIHFTNLYIYDNNNSNYYYPKSNEMSTYLENIWVKDSDENFISLNKDYNYSVNPETFPSIDSDNNLNIYIDMLPYKQISLSYEYNVPYKLKIVDEENNSRLVAYGTPYLDEDKDYIWYINTRTYASSSSDTYSYVPINENRAFKFENKFEEVMSINDPPLRADRIDYAGRYDYYDLAEWNEPFLVYDLNLEANREYKLNIYSKNNGGFTEGTNCYWYVVSPAKVCNGSNSNNSSFTTDRNGIYKLIFRPNDTAQTNIKIKYQLSTVYKSAGDVTLNIISSDIGSDSQRITISKTETTMTLTAPDGYAVYEWEVGNRKIGSGKSVTINISDFAGLTTGTTYFVTLKTKAINSTTVNWYTTTLELAATTEEAGNE